MTYHKLIQDLSSYIFRRSLIFLMILLIYIPGEGVVVDRIIAKVGQNIITLSEMEELARQSEIELSDETRNEVLDALIDRILLVQAAKDEKMNVPESRINIAVDREIRRIRNNFPTDSDYRKWLTRQLLTEEDMKIRLAERVEQEIMINQILRKRTSAIPDIKIEQFTRENPEEAEKQESVRIRHIFFAFSENATPEDEQKRKEKAYQVYHELKAGGKFEDLAYIYSDDSGTNESGGDLGYIRHGESLPEIEEVAFKLDAQQFSEPIRADKGYHIIQVTDKASVRQFLYEQALRETEVKLIQEMRAKTPIIIKS